MKKVFGNCMKYVAAISIITIMQCCSSDKTDPVFVAQIGAKPWTNTANADNTFFFLVDNNTNTSTFTGNENISPTKQASFTGALNNHNIQFTYDAGTDASRAGKTYKGTINDASTQITLTGTDATNPLPAITLKAQ